MFSGRITIGAACCADADLHAGAEPCIRGLREATKQLDHACPDVRIEVLKKLLLLVDEIVFDAAAEPLTLARGDQGRRSTVLRIRALLDVSLADQRADDPAGRAFVQKQLPRQRAEAHWPLVDKGLQRVALRHGHVVATDAVAVPKLIDADEVGDGRL